MASPIAQELVKRAGLRAGQDVLDIASGTDGPQQLRCLQQRQRLVHNGAHILHT